MPVVVAIVEEVAALVAGRAGDEMDFEDGVVRVAFIDLVDLAVALVDRSLFGRLFGRLFRRLLVIAGRRHREEVTGDPLAVERQGDGVVVHLGLCDGVGIGGSVRNDRER